MVGNVQQARWRVVGVLLGVMAGALMASRADGAGTIHLRDGRAIAAQDWWDDNGVLYYTTAGRVQQAEPMGSVLRIEGEPNWARAYRSDGRLIFRDGSFTDVSYVFVTRDEVGFIREDGAVVRIPRRELVRIDDIPLHERACAASTITNRELARTEALVNAVAGMSGATPYRLRRCLEIPSRTDAGPKADAQRDRGGVLRLSPERLLTWRYTTVYHESDTEADGRADSTTAEGQRDEPGRAGDAGSAESRVRDATRSWEAGPLTKHDQCAREGPRRAGDGAAGLMP